MLFYVHNNNVHQSAGLCGFSSQYVNVAENGSNQPTIAIASPSRAICRNDDYYYNSVCNADALLMIAVAVCGAVMRVVKV